MNNIKTINDLIRELSFIGAEPLPTDRLKGDLGFDSLKIIELILAFEATMNVLLEESDLDPAKITTVQDLYILAEKYAS